MKKSCVIFLVFVIFIIVFWLYGIFEKKYLYQNFVYIDKLNENFYKIQTNQDYGVAENKGNIIIKPLYNDIWYYNSEDKKGFKGEDLPVLFLVYKKGKFGIINGQGNFLCLVKYDDIININSYFYIIRKGNKYGLITYMGGIVLPIKYDGIRLIKNGKLEIKKGKKTVRVPFLRYNKKKI